MIDLYTANSSNGQRAAVILEECGLPYRVHKLDLMAGDQKKPEFLRINPASAIPVIVDPDGPGGRPLTLAQSAAIVLYIAEKTRKFIPADPLRRILAMQWFMQAMTDTARASMALFLVSVLTPDKSDANTAFFEQQTLRYFRVADARLEKHDFLADEISIADLALYPLYNMRRTLVDKAGDMPHLTRWGATLATRPGMARGIAAAA
jgi:GST-like protein